MYRLRRHAAIDPYEKVNEITCAAVNIDLKVLQREIGCGDTPPSARIISILKKIYMAKELKTNAMRFLEKNKIEYTVQTYQCDEFIDGIHVAEKLGQPLAETFKTLVAQGKSGAYYCFLVPVAETLDMKKAAKSVGEKSVELIAVKDITKITGYVRGGCTPIGMKKQFMTVVHDTAETMELFYISGGHLGVQIRLSPAALVKAIRGKFEDIVL